METIRKRERGFTFIELMVVVAIIGVLAGIAIPQFAAYREKAYRSEAFVLIGPVKEEIVRFYDYTGRLPNSNEEAGVAEAGHLKGKYVESITVSENGVITAVFQDYYSGPYAEQVSLRPFINAENPTGPLVWSEEKG